MPLNIPYSFRTELGSLGLVEQACAGDFAAIQAYVSKLEAASVTVYGGREIQFVAAAGGGQTLVAASSIVLATLSLRGDGVRPIYVTAQYDIAPASTGDWASVRSASTGSVPSASAEGIMFAYRSGKAVCFRIPPFSGSGTFVVQGWSSNGGLVLGGGNSVGSWAYWG